MEVGSSRCQGWFQGPPIMGPPYGKRDPYYSHNFRDSKIGIIWVPLTIRGSHVLGGPWKSPLKVGTNISLPSSLEGNLNDSFYRFCKGIAPLLKLSFRGRPDTIHPNWWTIECFMCLYIVGVWMVLLRSVGTLLETSKNHMFGKWDHVPKYQEWKIPYIFEKPPPIFWNYRPPTMPVTTRNTIFLVQDPYVPFGHSGWRV